MSKTKKQPKAYWCTSCEKLIKRRPPDYDWPYHEGVDEGEVVPCGPVIELVPKAFQVSEESLQTAFEQRRFKMCLVDGPDKFTVYKSPGSEWSYIELSINGQRQLPITMRSEHSVAIVHALLGRMLGK